MPERELLKVMAVAVRHSYAAAQEQAAAGNPATASAFTVHAETFEATRDYLIANQLTPAEREAFSEMLDAKLAATAATVKEQGFWSTTAGKATVVGVGISALVSLGSVAIQIFHLVHP